MTCHDSLLWGRNLCSFMTDARPYYDQSLPTSPSECIALLILFLMLLRNSSFCLSKWSPTAHIHDRHFICGFSQLRLRWFQVQALVPQTVSGILFLKIYLPSHCHTNFVLSYTFQRNLVFGSWTFPFHFRLFCDCQKECLYYLRKYSSTHRFITYASVSETLISLPRS